MEVMMNEPEIKGLEKYLKKGMTMLEWGSGGSTLHYSKFVKNYHSIEHDEEWYNKINTIKPDNVTLHMVPISESGRNMYPLTASTQPDTIHVVDGVPCAVRYEHAKTYVHYIDEISATHNISTFDVILIDGRGRVWCAEKALEYVNDDTIVVMHDYTIRSEYHGVEKWYDIIDTISTLVVMKVKK